VRLGHRRCCWARVSERVRGVVSQVCRDADVRRAGQSAGRGREAGRPECGLRRGNKHIAGRGCAFGASVQRGGSAGRGVVEQRVHSWQGGRLVARWREEAGGGELDSGPGAVCSACWPSAGGPPVWSFFSVNCRRGCRCLRRWRGGRRVRPSWYSRCSRPWGVPEGRRGRRSHADSKSRSRGNVRGVVAE
jgi:hypothetical protein